MHRPFFHAEALRTPARASLRDSPSARGIPTGVAPLPRYYDLIRLLHSLSLIAVLPSSLAELSGSAAPLCPAASTLPESSQQVDVGFTSTETLTTRKHLMRLYVGSSLALRPIPLSGKTPAHRSPFARLAVLIVCRFLYDIAPSAISSAELCLAYLW